MDEEEGVEAPRPSHPAKDLWPSWPRGSFPKMLGVSFKACFLLDIVLLDVSLCRRVISMNAFIDLLIYWYHARLHGRLKGYQTVNLSLKKFKKNGRHGRFLILDGGGGCPSEQIRDISTGGRDPT